MTTAAGGGAVPTVPAEVRMANQIAAQFRRHPDDKAAGEIATHLRNFWTPWMLERLERFAGQGGAGGAAGEGGGLDPLVLRAVELLRAPAG